MDCPKSILRNAGKLNLTLAEIARAVRLVELGDYSQLVNNMENIVLLWMNCYSDLQLVSSDFKELYNRQLGA